MVENVYYVDCDNLNPYHAQGLQAYLLNNIPDDSMVFMMWQSMDTISLGNQQCAYSECNIDRLEIERTYLARRNSIGKAIFADMGCIHYAFFVYLNNYDIMSQINVIYQALSRLDVQAYINNSHEIFVEGRQITDNVYLTSQEKCMHAGVIYWDCDKSKRARLLKDGKSKKNIGNITDTDPLINLPQLKNHILQCLADQYGPVFQLSILENFEDLVEYYHSYKYIYDTDNNYSLKISDQYENGQLQLYVDMNKNKIIHVDVYAQSEDVQLQEVVQYVFDNLLIDDVVFRRRANRCHSRYRNDLNKIYQRIKKDSYRI